VDRAGVVRRAIYHGDGDARAILRAAGATSPAGIPMFPLLRGPKISRLWIRELAYPGGADLTELEAIEVAVDVQVRKVTEYLGVTDTGDLTSMLPAGSSSERGRLMSPPLARPDLARSPIPPRPWIQPYGSSRSGVAPRANRSVAASRSRPYVPTAVSRSGGSRRTRQRRPDSALAAVRNWHSPVGTSLSVQVNARPPLPATGAGLPHDVSNRQLAAAYRRTNTGAGGHATAHVRDNAGFVAQSVEVL
jgi:hypothetical protein